jgi:hypothetical protein
VGNFPHGIQQCPRDSDQFFPDRTYSLDFAAGKQKKVRTDNLWGGQWEKPRKTKKRRSGA